LAVGGWRIRLAVGGSGWRLAVGGSGWRLADPVGGWRIRLAVESNPRTDFLLSFGLIWLVLLLLPSLRAVEIGQCGRRKGQNAPTAKPMRLKVLTLKKQKEKQERGRRKIAHFLRIQACKTRVERLELKIRTKEGLCEVLHESGLSSLYFEEYKKLQAWRGILARGVK